MDWTIAIERNRAALKRILALMVAMAGGEAFLPRRLHRAILAVLRPAEAAARRLVIVVARDLVVPPARRRKIEPRPGSIFVRDGTGTGIVLPHGVRPGPVLSAPGLPALAPPCRAPRLRALPLLDPLPCRPGDRRRPARGPRISWPGSAELRRSPQRLPPLPDDAIDAGPLALRLQALGRALDDLPAHARRFARWRCHALGGEGRGLGYAEPPRRVWPLRPGRPPGGRRRPTHEVHAVLADLHSFAFLALEQARDGGEAGRRDTS